MAEITGYMRLTKLSEAKLIILDQKMYVDPTKSGQEYDILKTLNVVITEKSMINFSNLV